MQFRIWIKVNKFGDLMKILVIGSGAREHAIAWKLSEDSRVEKIFMAPGNAGTAHEHKCENVDIKYNDIPALLDFAQKNRIDLTVVGPEEPLSKGIVDIFEAKNFKIFGPCKDAAMIEASKAFAKDIMINALIPTAAYAEFNNYEKALLYVEKHGAPIVVKADGLAAGKGVTVAKTAQEAQNALKEIFLDKIFGESGSTVVIEEFMDGEEATYLAITDGETIIPLDVSQDHKQVFDGDKGPNTGGMGAYCPAPIVDKSKFERITREIANPMVQELARRGITYKGVIYAGLMIKGDDIKVVEFNCRFGDPECEVILSRMKDGFLDALLATCDGSLSNVQISSKDGASVCVVMASGGYPKSYKSGYPIKGLDEITDESVKIFHAGTKLIDGKICTAGGRVLCVTAHAETLQDSIGKAYAACEKISWDGVHYRHDIGEKALK